MHANKYVKAMTALLCTAVLFTGCSGSTAPEDEQTVQTAKTVSEIYQEIEQTVSLRSPQCMDEDFILNYYDIDTASLEEYVFSMSEDAAQAEMIIIMKVRSTEDLKTYADGLQTIVEDKKEEMEDYIPEQYAIVEKSRVQTKDPYLWLVISENADKIIDIIENGLF